MTPGSYQSAIIKTNNDPKTNTADVEEIKNLCERNYMYEGEVNIQCVKDHGHVNNFVCFYCVQ